MSLAVYFPSDGRELEQDYRAFESRLNSTRKRTIVFFDESITGYLVYKGNRARSTTVDIEVNVIPKDILENEGVQNSFLEDVASKDTAFGTFETFSTKVTASDVIFNKETEDNTVVIVWKVTLPLVYPKRRLHNPKFVISCYYGPFDEVPKSHESSPCIAPDVGAHEVHLKDFAPADGNLLSELSVPFHHNSLTLLQNNILEERKISNSSSNESLNTFKLEDHHRITCRATTNIDICTPLVIRLKSTKPAGRNECLLATLSIDISESLVKLMKEWDEDYLFEIESVNVCFNSGAMASLDSIQFPVKLESSESISLTYRLVCDDHLNTENGTDRSSIKPVNFKVAVKVLRRDQSFTPLTNAITTNWTPSLDFGVIAPPTNNSLKTSISSQAYSQIQTPILSNVVMTPHIGSSSNLSKLSVKKIFPSSSGGANGFSRLPLQSFQAQKKLNRSLITPLNSSPITVNLATNASSALSGLKLIFEGRFNMKLGEVTKWKVKAMNNSLNRMSLSLIMQNPINFNPVYVNPGLQFNNNNFLSSNLLSSTKATGDILIYNKLDLQSQYSSLKQQQNGVIVLNNDIRIGPLDPNSVFETELTLIGISKGIYNLTGLKVFEINSGDGLDFGKLVEVFVV
ncbi:uncharacterized protein KQ657_004329 [Scheffersomyces spartinae]|uniref:Trafficking protein particle complex II-specific subunit 65 IgD3 domain-containing protein n=1 Tax=Scheffersomyces spartinae TaxID=45513 RepID=A0A9P8AIR2_9ASCO|nr:uncharacterized protein KQ657_004329 [Scheffersomyces spartinae]KAG7194653.1 hypothetical protein KQ657_004329 [Scheffersomyces spartinae]